MNYNKKDDKVIEVITDLNKKIKEDQKEVFQILLHISQTFADESVSKSKRDELFSKVDLLKGKIKENTEKLKKIKEDETFAFSLISDEDDKTENENSIKDDDIKNVVDDTSISSDEIFNTIDELSKDLKEIEKRNIKLEIGNISLESKEKEDEVSNITTRRKSARRANMQLIAVDDKTNGFNDKIKGLFSKLKIMLSKKKKVS